MKSGGMFGRFFAHFFRTTLMLWGLLVPAAMVQIYYNGKQALADPDFINTMAIASFFVVVGALLLAYMDAREQSKAKREDLD